MSYWVILIFCVPRDQFLQARMAQDIWMFVRTGLLVCKLMRNVIPPSEERRTPNTNQSISFIQFTNQIAKLPNCDIQMMKVIPFWKWSKVDITFEPKISEMQFLEIAAAYCLNNSLPSGGISIEINWIFFFQETQINYRNSFRMNFALHGYQATGYHIVNLAFHGLCTLAVYDVIKTLSWSSSCSSDLTAFLTAIVFAIHPVHTEAVKYCPQIIEAYRTIFRLQISRVELSCWCRYSFYCHWSSTFRRTI